MNSFFSLFISSELNQTLLDATYWSGIFQLVGSIMTAITAPVWGLMCDRIGTKKILLIALAGNATTFAGMGASTSVTNVIIFRGLQGAFGGTSTIMFALVASVVPAGEFKTAISHQLAAMTMSQIAAPGIGGILASIIGYRLTFAASSLLYLSITPLVMLLRIPPPVDDDGVQFGFSDIKAILPDAFALVLVYSCISFITPMISWFLESLGIPYGQLLTFTALTTILNGLAFAAAAPIFSKVITDKTLHIPSLIAAVGIFATAFVRNPYQFMALRVSIGAIQAGVPPSLLGGKSGRKGVSMGLLNSARFIGQAIGPFLAASILSDGTFLSVLYMFTTMMSISLLTAIITYITHVRHTSIQSS